MIKSIFSITILSSVSLGLISCGKSDRSSACSPEPRGKLSIQNLKDIVITDETKKFSNRTTTTEVVGYRFRGTPGRTLRYNSDSDVCIWIIDPNNRPIDNPSLTEAGLYTVQIAAKQGNTDFDFRIGYEPLPAPSPDNPPAPPNTSLTPEEALNIVKGWYEAKPKILGPSLDRELAAKYITGKRYREFLVRDGGGWLANLKIQGCYYVYQFARVNQVLDFTPADDMPSLTVQVSERFYLKGCPRTPAEYSPETKLITFYFKQDAGNWKIYDFKQF